MIQERSSVRARVPVAPATRGLLAAAAAVCVVVSSWPAVAVGGDDSQRRRRGRDRAEIERTVEVLGLEPGMTVAEIGAGNGRFSLRFAEVVGPDGRVYANELDSDAVQRIRERAQERGLDNLVGVQGAVNDTKLPDACCEAMMMRMVYHMLTDPEPMAESFYRGLKPGGLLLILEGDPEPDEPDADGVPENRAGMGIDPAIVIEELGEVGFVFDREIEDWQGADYALMFHKPDRED